jgi:peptide/nickel transport system substrate-binding protein
MKIMHWKYKSFVLVMLAALILGACAPAVATSQPPTAQTAPTQQATSNPVSNPQPTIGGTLVVGVTNEPTTLDPSKASSPIEEKIMSLIGGSLNYIDPEGNYLPYLADSWTTSADGLVWDFIIRKGVKFQNGDALTANDFAYTYNRALDPQIASPAAGPALGDVKSIEAVDDYTLRITLKSPNYPLLYGLADAGYMAPIPSTVVEAMGDSFGRNLISVGPYKLKEWVAGEKIVLERNADFAWPPSTWKDDKTTNYFDTIEFRFIPEYATILAGLQSGDIDAADIQPKDVQMIKDLGQVELLKVLSQGTYPAIWLNITKAPFDNLQVRQAFNYAVDRDQLIKIIVQGNAEPQKGPLSSSVVGYWKGIEDLGYGFDLAKAKDLMTQAGYVSGSDGILTKDGKPFSLTLYTDTQDEQWVKLAEVLKEQFKALGVEVSIVSEDHGNSRARLKKGDFEMSIAGQKWGEADTMFFMFHSSMINAYNWSRINSPALDALLQQTRNDTDPTQRQQAVNDTAKYVVEQALLVPLYAPMEFIAVNNRIQGLLVNQIGVIETFGAYVK